MGYKVILAEKPSVARSIAQVVGATAKCDGYFEGNGYQVTWAYGHLVTLCDTEDYDAKYSKWKKSDLPIFPEVFKYKVLKDGEEQFKIVKKLFCDADEIICATDAGREGEAIFRNIYYHTKTKKPFKRLWISALVDKEIKRGMSDLRDGSEYDNLYYSAQQRAFADWLIGINATRAFTLANYNKGMLSIGRVQTPTFSFICKRFYEYLNFVPSSSYVPTCMLTYGKSKPFKVQYPEAFATVQEAQAVIDEVGTTMTVVNKESKLVTEKAPLPFNLSSLQQAANKRYNFSAQHTLDVLQKLYESKLVSYPRTESAYYNEVLIEQIGSNISKLGRHFDNKKVDGALSLLSGGIKNKEAFNDSKVADHHALMPMFDTMELAKDLSGDSKKIYDMVALQMLASILPHCKKNQTTYKFEYAKGKTPMKASGSVIKEAGWRTLKGDGDDEDVDEDTQTLPDLKEGDICDVKEKSVAEKVTKRPTLLTEATLLKQMETAGKMVDDKELKKSMVSGIGTAATRASIIELIKKRNLVEVKDKKYFVPTELGMQIYASVKDLKVASPTLTGEWEYRLNQIAEGKYDKDEFLKGIKEYTRSLISECSQCKLGGAENNEMLLGGDEVCPICGSPLVENGKTVSCCKNTKQFPQCQFVIWKTIANHRITDDEIRDLLTEGKTKLIEDFKSKKGSSFSARLVMNKETKTVEFAYDEANSNGVVEGLNCPMCDGNIIEKEKMYVCQNNVYGDQNSCKFVIWKTIAGYKVTMDDVIEIIRTHRLSNKKFISKAKKPFTANLVFSEDFSKSNFEFIN